MSYIPKLELRGFPSAPAAPWRSAMPAYSADTLIRTFASLTRSKSCPDKVGSPSGCCLLRKGSGALGCPGMGLSRAFEHVPLSAATLTAPTTCAAA